MYVETPVGYCSHAWLMHHDGPRHRTVLRERSLQDSCCGIQFEIQTIIIKISKFVTVAWDILVSTSYICAMTDYIFWLLLGYEDLYCAGILSAFFTACVNPSDRSRFHELSLRERRNSFLKIHFFFKEKNIGFGDKHDIWNKMSRHKIHLFSLPKHPDEFSRLTYGASIFWIW